MNLKGFQNYQVIDGYLLAIVYEIGHLGCDFITRSIFTVVVKVVHNILCMRCTDCISEKTK